MRKGFLIIVAIIAVSLLVGCGQKDILKPVIDAPGAEDNISETATDNDSSTESNDKNLTITQEDLDELKEKLDDITLEDLDRLSDV